MIPRSALVLTEFQDEWRDGAGRLNCHFHDRSFLLMGLETPRRHSLQPGARQYLSSTQQWDYSPDYRELGRTDFRMRGAIAHHGRSRDSTREFAADFGPQWRAS